MIAAAAAAISALLGFAAGAWLTKAQQKRRAALELREELARGTAMRERLRVEALAAEKNFSE